MTEYEIIDNKLCLIHDCAWTDVKYTQGHIKQCEVCLKYLDSRTGLNISPSDAMDLQYEILMSLSS